MNITIPDEVARRILFHQIHPVTAWREYYKMSKKELSEITGFSEAHINKIENSNLHLEREHLMQLSKAFFIKPEALTIRQLFI